MDLTMGENAIQIRASKYNVIIDEDWALLQLAKVEINIELKDKKALDKENIT